MRKPVLGFDLDGVLYNWHQAAYDYLVRFCGLIDEPYEEFLFVKSKFLSNKPKLFVENLVRLEDLYYKFPAKKEDVDTLQKLSKKYTIVYVSARPQEVDFVTRKWLEDFNFPNYKEVYLAEDKVREIRYLGCNYYVEDMSHFAVDISKVAEVFLMAKAYNKTYQQYFKTIVSVKELERYL